MSPVSPIYKLPPDILYTIFFLNATTPDTRHLQERYTARQISAIPNVTLRTTLLSSSVCRSWRDLLLTSPAIWGRLFDLDILSQSPQLRDQVLTLAKSSPLHVVGNESIQVLTGKGSRSVWRKNELLLPFLCGNWNRVRSLDIRCTTQSFVDGLVAFVLTKPAPLLEHFDFRGPYQANTNGRTLFSSTAPSLRLYICKSFRFDNSTLWAMQLRTLVLELREEISTTSTLDDLLQTLPLMENLQTLAVYAPALPDVDLHTFSSFDSLSTGTQIRLHHLSYFYLTGSLTYCSRIMSLIHTLLPANCATYISSVHMRHEPRHPYNPSFEPIIHTFDSVVKAHAGTRPLTTLRWYLSSNRFSFIGRADTEEPIHDTPHILDEPDFDVSSPYVGFSFWGMLLRAVPFQRIPPSMLADVTHLHWVLATRVSPRKESDRELNGQIVAQIQRLGQVEDLMVNDVALEWIIGVIPVIEGGSLGSSSPLLPALKVLRIPSTLDPCLRKRCFEIFQGPKGGWCNVEVLY